MIKKEEEKIKIDIIILDIDNIDKFTKIIKNGVGLKKTNTDDPTP